MVIVIDECPSRCCTIFAGSPKPPSSFRLMHHEAKQAGANSPAGLAFRVHRVFAMPVSSSTGTMLLACAAARRGAAVNALTQQRRALLLDEPLDVLGPDLNCGAQFRLVIVMVVALA
jgi:hypothetical protein